MLFSDRDRLREFFAGKSVAVVGSGPGSLQNAPGFVDSHDVVVRVNNYKLSAPNGFRTDVYYSYFGNAIKKTPAELKSDGTYLCICKCPNAKAVESEWHERNGKLHGIDYRWIYEKRAAWWFCDTYVPSVDEFRAHFDMLGGHVPTTGFSAILTVLECDPASVYATGFDFFQSRVHNVNERWRPGDPADPIGHDPVAEREWMAKSAGRLPLTMDDQMKRALDSGVSPVHVPATKRRPSFLRRRRMR